MKQSRSKNRMIQTARAASQAIRPGRLSKHTEHIHAVSTMRSLPRRPSGVRLDEIGAARPAAADTNEASLFFKTKKATVAFGLGVVFASGWLIAASQGILEKFKFIYIQPAGMEKSLLVFHIIEQLLGWANKCTLSDIQLEVNLSHDGISLPKCSHSHRF